MSLYRCVAGRCHSIEEAFHCPHGGSSGTAVSRAAPVTVSKSNMRALGAIAFIAADSGRNKDGAYMDVDAFDYAAYLANGGPLYLEHDRSIPVGRTVYLERHRDIPRWPAPFTRGARVSILLGGAEIYEPEIWRAIVERDLHGVSIAYHIDDGTLMEISLVGSPMCPGAHILRARDHAGRVYNIHAELVASLRRYEAARHTLVRRRIATDPTYGTLSL